MAVVWTKTKEPKCIYIINLFSGDDRWQTKAFFHKLLGERQRENQRGDTMKNVRLVVSACWLIQEGSKEHTFTVY